MELKSLVMAPGKSEEIRFLATRMGVSSASRTACKVFRNLTRIIAQDIQIQEMKIHRTQKKTFKKSQ